jgi:hypothetical protein
MYTEEQLMARLKFFIGICLALTLTGIVFVVLYSIIFITQPLNAISPIDQKFFELIIPIATFLTGTLSGIMLASPGDKEAQKQALAAANKGWDKPPTPTSTGGSSSGFNSSPSGFTAPSAPSAGFGNAPLGGNSASSFTPAPSWGTTPTATGSFGGSSGFGAPTTPAVTASGKAIVPDAPHPEL